MPSPSRFGASKFRNAVPQIPSKEEWYRGSLPASSGTSSTVTTFSSEIKTNRQWVVTLSNGGDISYRLYGATGPGAEVGKGKVGSGQIGDWDLSRLEDGLIVVGGMNGSIYIYSLPAPSTPTSPLIHIHTIEGSSPITNIALHPTTPNILLASSLTTSLGIYDLSNTSGSLVITLQVTEPKGLWSTAWSQDGTKVAAIGKSGTAYIFSPRSSSEPMNSRQLPIQALKPARICWIGEDIFVTAFSKSRNREYHLFSGQNLSTVFTNTLDTSPGLLIPVADNERRLVYLSARGDMSLRQVEIGGPTGYQETIHPLPSQLASTALSLCWPGILPVMSAQIATLLVTQVDKDGDTILPFGIRVPRRQLIDYHDDLYPEITGTIPEQTAGEWLQGGDKAPLLISLDPSRRGTWEKRLQDLPKTERTKSSPPVADSSATEKASLSPVSSSVAKAEGPLNLSSVQIPDGSATSQKSISAASEGHEETQDTQTSTDESPRSEQRPPLEGDETYISTGYKGRIMGDHIGQQLKEHRSKGKKGPLMVGLQGPQGCGKTTLCNALLSYLQAPPRSLRIAVLSLDDLYKTNQGLKDVAAQNPDNKLLAGRGPPGTHDPELAVKILTAVEAISEGRTVDLPIFDKSLCGGEGDRSTETVKVTGPLDVFILEGWSMGFAPLASKDLEQRYESKTTLSDTSYFLSHPLTSLVTLNNYLRDLSSKVYKYFETIVQIEPESYQYVFDWRLEQERNMKASNGGKGMSDEQVQRFVERYMPGYELWKNGVWDADQPWAGKGLRLWYGKNREVIKVDVPEAKAKAETSDSTEVKTSLVLTSAVPEEASKASSNEEMIVTAMKESSPDTTQQTDVPTTRPSMTSGSQAASSTSTSAIKAQSSNAESASSGTRYNPGWSRKFLAAKAPLIPSYDQIPTLSTLHQDSQILKCTPHLVFFPIQGPGGRIGVHPLKKKGRMVTGGEGYLSGGIEVTDYDVDPFVQAGKTRVALAGEDGVVRVWSVGEDGINMASAEPELVLKGQGIDKIAQLVFHPTAKDLLVLATNDGGSAHLRFFDLGTSSEVISLSLGTTGIFNVAWSSSGSHLAVATKDGRILVLDPRKSDSLIQGKAHDSPRSFQMAWIDATHIISVGFSKGSQRRINLYRVGEDIQTVHSLLIDVSPSVLFPVYDADTSILYVWGKGERQIQAYEVHPEHATEPIAKLPSYTAGSPQLGLAFFPKSQIDVKKVEVAKALRLTAKTIEEVTFSIPRNKPDFFQDDIYVDTLDVETPAMTAAEWLKGGDTPLKRISLRPEGMTPLSEAPKTTSQAKAKFVPARDVLSEAEKKKREMDALFAKAKLNDSSDEDDEPKRTGIDPPDDDW